MTSSDIPVNNVGMDTRRNELTGDFLRRKADVERIGLFSSGGGNIGHAGMNSDVRSSTPLRGLAEPHSIPGSPSRGAMYNVPTMAATTLEIVRHGVADARLRLNLIIRQIFQHVRCAQKLD